MSPDSESDHIALTVPAKAQFLGTVRLLASAVASAASMNIDDVDDLRIAADELSYLLMSASIGGPELSLSFTVKPNHVVIEGRRAGWKAGDPVPTPSDLMAKILAQVVDHFDIAAEGEVVQFRAAKDARNSDEPVASLETGFDASSSLD